MSLESPKPAPIHIFNSGSDEFWRPPNAEETDYAVARLSTIARFVANNILGDDSETLDKFEVSFINLNSSEKKRYLLSFGKSLGTTSLLFIVERNYKNGGSTSSMYNLLAEYGQSLDQRKSGFSVSLDSFDKSGINTNDVSTVKGCKEDEPNGWVGFVYQMPLMNLGRLNDMHDELTECAIDAKAMI